MVTDWPDILAVTATLATLIASIYGAKAAAIAARKAGLHGHLLLEQQHDRDWLLGVMPQLQESSILVDVADTAPALSWVQAGLLEWVPMPITGSAGRLVVRLKRATSAPLVTR